MPCTRCATHAILPLEPRNFTQFPVIDLLFRVRAILSCANAGRVVHFVYSPCRASSFGDRKTRTNNSFPTKDPAVPDFATLENLRKNHPAWRLLCAQHAPLIISFLHRVFVAPNRRTIAQADLVEALEDELFALREEYGSSAFPETAIAYLNSWAENDKGWLRKFYPHGTDEPHFDLTPATEKAITWISSLTERSFVGTESRLLTLFELLRQMDEGTQNDPKVRKAELLRRKKELERQIAELEKGRRALPRFGPGWRSSKPRPTRDFFAWKRPL